MKRSIKIQKLIDELGLTPLYLGDREHMEIDTSDLNRPGLQMCGFFEYFAVERIQLFGMAEMTYLQDLSPEVRRERLETYFSYPIPGVLIARNLTPPPDISDNLYDLDDGDLTARNIGALPETLKDALDAMEGDALVMGVLGEHVAEHYIRGKRREWQEYQSRVSNWELEKYLVTY